MNEIIDFAPICLFVYNRVDLTRKTLESLQNNINAVNSDLFVFSDAPKFSSQDENVQHVRNFIKSISKNSFKSITIIEREFNLGLANSIISGVTEIVNKYGKIIVLEDDLVTSKYFINYMNGYLNLYEDDYNVASIHAWAFSLRQNDKQTYFLRGADCWGWATWSRAWKYFEPDGKLLLNKLKSNNLENKFNFEGAYPYIKMLKNQISGKNNSWAIRWHASTFIAGMLTLHPRETLIQNIGFDNQNSTHTKSSDISGLYAHPIKLSREIFIEKIIIEEDKETRQEIIDLLREKFGVLARIKRKLKKFLFIFW